MDHCLLFLISFSSRNIVGNLCVLFVLQRRRKTDSSFRHLKIKQVCASAKRWWGIKESYTEFGGRKGGQWEEEKTIKRYMVLSYMLRQTNKLTEKPKIIFPFILPPFHHSWSHRNKIDNQVYVIQPPIVSGANVSLWTVSILNVLQEKMIVRHPSLSNQLL